MISTTHITDLQRLDFIQALLKSELLLSEWEEQFTNSFLQSSRPSLWFTAGRRQATDRMWMKFGALLNFPYPTDEIKPAVMAEAQTNACEFWVKDENRQLVRCNEPATLVNRQGFRYCQDHGEAAQKDVKRRGGKMELITYVAKI